MTKTKLSGLPGHGVEVLYNGISVPVTNFGFLNDRTTGVFTIQIWKKKDNNFPFRTSPVYRVSSKKNIIELPAENGVVSLEVPIYENSNSWLGYTKKGNARFIAYSSSGDVCEYEACVFSQDGNHYFSMVKNWHKKLSLSPNGDLVMNVLEWPQMIEFCQNLAIPPGKYVPKQKSDLSLDPGHGKVEWFNVGTGTGLIRAYNNQLAKVHYSDILGLSSRNPRVLFPNQIVKADFSETPTEEQRRSSFRIFARNIRPIAT